MDFVGSGKRRSAAGFARAAEIVGCDEAALLAVVQVEAAGSGFDAKRRPKALFEPHKFHAHLSGEKRARAVKAGLAYPKWGAKPYPKDSYDRIARACAIDEAAALKATSWGLGQIMGANFVACGFASPQAMVEAFKTGEDAQLEAMARFIAGNKPMRAALRRHDWAEFARLYNGPGFARNRYDVKLAAAYAKLARAPEPVTLAAPEPAPEPQPRPAEPVALAPLFEPAPEAEAAPASVSGDPQPPPPTPAEPPVTAKALRKAGSRIAKQSYAQKIKGWLGIGTGAGVGGVGLLGEVKDQAESARSAWDSLGAPLLAGLKAVPLWLWGGVIVAAGLWLWWSARRIERARVEDEAKRRTRL